jgi:dTDP-4-dehydrorhamnose reductase
MQKLLILGGAGMLGHKAYQVFSKYMETFATFRSFDNKIISSGIFDEKHVIDNVDANDFNSVKKAIDTAQPTHIINCIGIIKQLKEARNPRISIYINSLFPHLLAEYADSVGAKLILISTDCVFSGKRGNYREDDVMDAEDLYGRSKSLGEVVYGDSLTIRTSIIGHEVSSHVSLVDWLLSNKDGRVSGYKRAIYTGFPTITLAMEILRVVNHFPDLTGLYQVSSNPISKYELLQIIDKQYKTHISIGEDDKFFCDRSLDSSRYRMLTGFQPQSWIDMINDMHQDFIATKYKKEGHDEVNG